MISEGHCDLSAPKFTSFRTLGKPNTFGDNVTSKRAGKVPLGTRPDIPESNISVRATSMGFCVAQLKMDMPPIFAACCAPAEWCSTPQNKATDGDAQDTQMKDYKIG